eukprot:scaffold12884_cov111-Isochrysis_galbana.AAC.1
MRSVRWPGRPTRSVHAAGQEAGLDTSRRQRAGRPVAASVNYASQTRQATAARRALRSRTLPLAAPRAQDRRSNHRRSLRRLGRRSSPHPGAART